MVNITNKNFLWERVARDCRDEEEIEKLITCGKIDPKI